MRTISGILSIISRIAADKSLKDVINVKFISYLKILIGINMSYNKTKLRHCYHKPHSTGSVETAYCL